MRHKELGKHAPKTQLVFFEQLEEPSSYALTASFYDLGGTESAFNGGFGL